MDESRLPNLAQVAYEKYAQHQSWKNYQGNPIPQWDEVRADIKQAWYVAVKHVIELAETL